MIWDEPCVQTYRAAVEEFVHLEVVTPESQSTLSGAAGFAVAPIAYKLGKKGFLLNDDARTRTVARSASPHPFCNLARCNILLALRKISVSNIQSATSNRGCCRSICR